MSTDPNDRPARFRWLPPGARPPMTLPRRQEVVLLLVGTTYLFSGYDLNVYGLAIPQIQHSLGIAEDAVGPTVAYFRLAAFPALLLALSADIFGRRRVLLFTVLLEALMTLATSFAQTRVEFIWLQVLARVFGYCEEMLCVVVIAEEIEAHVRGWATGTLGAMWAVGAGLASAMFAAITILPFGWRAMYFIGGTVLMTLAYYRRWLPETKRFELRREEVALMGSKLRAGADTLRRLLHEYPGRLAAMMTVLFTFGLATGPASVLMSKYLQTTHHYAPHQVSLLYIFGGLVSVAGNIAAGRISDRIGRKTVVIIAMLAAGGGFAVFFSGYDGVFLPGLWIVALFGYLSGDALLAGYAVEIFPTAYRATLGGLRYVFVIMGGALGLALEGVFYDRFGSHGPAVSISLAAIPVALMAVLLLPEPARRVLEEIAPASAE